MACQNSAQREWLNRAISDTSHKIQVSETAITRGTVQLLGREPLQCLEDYRVLGCGAENPLRLLCDELKRYGFPGLCPARMKHAVLMLL